MGRRVITYEDAVHGGRRLFARRANIEMQELADELAVSRATLYRVTPGRDRLLGDVLWSYARPMFDAARDRSRQRGAERLLEVLGDFGQQIMTSEPFRRFIATDPDTAIRVLFTSAGAVHERFVDANAELIRETVEAGELAPPFDLDHLAYVFARIYESMWYADLLSGREPDLEIAERTARAVLTSGARREDVGHAGGR